jgi:hypothetical protein
MRWIVMLLLAAPAVAQTLTPALKQWKTEIETAGLPILVARVNHNPASNAYSLPDGIEGRELFAEYLGQRDFIEQFQHMYGVMVHHKGIREAYLVMLNMSKANEWGADEEAVLAHEFGHAWIKSRKYPAPFYQTGLAGCLAIHTGDIAQHVLIRKELDRRSIDHRTFWLKSLDRAVAQSSAMGPPPEDDRCIRVRQAAELVDVRLGLAGREWAGRDAYEAMVKRLLPEVEPTVAAILDWLRTHDMEDVDQHRQSLRVVFDKLKALAYARSAAYIL